MRPRTWVLVLAAVFAVLQLADVTGRDTPDSKNYVSYALTLGGADQREAAVRTADWVCAGQASEAARAQSVNVVRFHAPSPAGRVFARCREDELRRVETRWAAGQGDGHIVPFVGPRLRAVFEVRPGYPLFLLPFVAALGVTWCRKRLTVSGASEPVPTLACTMSGATAETLTVPSTDALYT